MADSLSILPLSPGQLRVGQDASVQVLISAGLSKEEALLKLANDFDAWLDRTSSIQKMSSEVGRVLDHATWDAPRGVSRQACYESIIGKLEDRFKISRREAAIVLSHLPLMLVLAKDFRASPARIACLMMQSDGRTTVGWRVVDAVLREFGIKCELQKAAVEKLLAEDHENAARQLGDSTIESMVESLTEQAKVLGMNGSFAEAFVVLLGRDGDDAFVPYLQTLLYLAVVDAFFDHPSEYLYTFRPRGEVANHVFSQFPSTLAPGGNPVLNNLKAVDRLTTDWAESRDEMREQSKALVRIVQGLSSLSHAARSGMSAGIRRAILRFIDIKTPANVRVPDAANLETVKLFLERIAKAETGTRGVIEQRTADFLGLLEHPLPAWRGRGLGDPVNASNSSSGKLGDCDFQNLAAQECVAMEAHAGRLTDVYVREHLRTLRRNLPVRRQEWERISEIEKWKLRIRFLVHEDARTSETAPMPAGIESLDVVTFQDQLQKLLPAMDKEPEKALALFNDHIVARLNAPNTPLETKKIAKTLLKN